MRKIGYAATTIVAVLALAVGPAVAASADASASYSNGGYLRSSAYYNASLDRVSSTDERNDGWGSIVRWELNSGGGGSKTNLNGAGSTDYGYPSFGSSTMIRIKSGSVNNGVHVGDGAFSAYVNI